MNRRPSFRRRYFALAALGVLAGHWFVVPRMFAPLLERPERPVEVAFVDEDGLAPIPKSLVDEIPPPPPKATPTARSQRRRDQKRIEKDKPEKEPEKVVDKKPPPVVPQPVVVKPPPPPPPMEKQVHQKMVDQDKFPDEADNADAKYLAQKNHRAQRDTQAMSTNLVRDQPHPTESVSEKSESKAAEPGMKERKIAELQKRAGVEHRLVRSRPRPGDAGKSEKSAPGVLSMRGLTPRSVEQKGEVVKARDGVELKDEAEGSLAAARQGNAGERAGSRARGDRRANLNLGAADYDKIVGEAVAQSERDRGAKAEVSHADGRWAKLQKKQAAMRSALENFVNEAYVGRESELGTRAHPYAAYIAEMHRSIHKLWAFSFIPSLDSRGALDPFNDMTRWTMISMVLTDAGAVESANISRPSGYLPFDAAAWDVVMTAGPFSKPPEAIKSYDGKVYIDWVFHRDERQCGTDFVIPHILTGDKRTMVVPPTGAGQQASVPGVGEARRAVAIRHAL